MRNSLQATRAEIEKEVHQIVKQVLPRSPWRAKAAAGKMLAVFGPT